MASNVAKQDSSIGADCWFFIYLKTIELHSDIISSENETAYQCEVAEKVDKVKHQPVVLKDASEASL